MSKPSQCIHHSCKQPALLGCVRCAHHRAMQRTSDARYAAKRLARKVAKQGPPKRPRDVLQDYDAIL